jgi:hypothetical protein
MQAGQSAACGAAASRRAPGMAFELEVSRVDESYPEALQRELDTEVARAWPRSTGVVGGRGGYSPRPRLPRGQVWWKP